MKSRSWLSSAPMSSSGRFIRTLTIACKRMTILEERMDDGLKAGRQVVPVGNQPRHSYSVEKAKSCSEREGSRSGGNYAPEWRRRCE